MNYTDDARLVDSFWDNRHHVTPSHFNVKNTKHFKVSLFLFKINTIKVKF